MMQTETLDRLYLEWSQFTGARTSREIASADEISRLRGLLERATVLLEVVAYDAERYGRQAWCGSWFGNDNIVAARSLATEIEEELK